MHTLSTAASGTAHPLDPSAVRTGMYWCMATMTSVGYGDLYPVTLGGQIVSIFTALSGTI